MDQTYFPRGGAKEKPVIQFKKFVFEKKKTSKFIKKGNRKETESKLPKFIKLPAVENTHLHINFSDLKPGLQCLCAVNGITKDKMFVELPFGKRAVISKSEISESYSQSNENKEESKNLFKMFYIGQLLSCKIIKCDLNNDKSGTIYITLKPKSVNWKLNSGMVTKHSMIQMAISSVEDHGYFMETGVTGVTAFLPFNEAFKYCKQVLGWKQTMAVGAVMWCYVLKSTVNSSGANVLEVTIDPHKTSEAKTIHPSSILCPGFRIDSTITKVYDDGCCQILLNGNKLHGYVDSTLNFTLGSDNDLTEGFRSPATVIAYNPLTNVTYFSFSHHVGKTTSPVITKQDLFEKGTYKATVKKVDKLFAYLGLDEIKFNCFTLINPKIRSNDNENDSTANLTSNKFEPGDIVYVTIKRLDVFKKMYLCLIDRKLTEKYKIKEEVRNHNGESLFLSEIKEENDSDIEIKQEVESDLDNQNDSDIINEDKKSDKNNSKEKKKKKKKKKKTKKSSLNEDDNDVEMEKNESDVSLKEEFLTYSKKNDTYNEDNTSSDVKDTSSDNDPTLSKRKRKSSTEFSEVLDKKKNRTDSPEKFNTNKSMMSELVKKKLEEANKISLKDVDSTFMWDATPDDLAKITRNDVEEFNEESDEEKPAKKHLSKKQKKINELEKERKIREKEEELLKALEEPKSADHYERLILSRPDDSSVWIKYMSYYLEATEIEKARNIAKRALKLISHRNEQDRLNIWLALLNLEHLYGSKDLFKETWMEALKSNDDYQINCKVLDMYVNDSNAMEVSTLVQKMTKQYRDNGDCWYACLSALMSSGLKEKARDLLQRALKTLPIKSHITLISRFALLENSFGHSEKSQALFDNLLTSYPSRIDIWFVYVDMLLKSDMIDLARQVFERATNNKLPARKMKSIYKKWLEFEEKNGSEETVENVRQSAAQYVEKASNEIGE